MTVNRIDWRERKIAADWSSSSLMRNTEVQSVADPEKKPMTGIHKRVSLFMSFKIKSIFRRSKKWDDCPLWIRRCVDLRLGRLPWRCQSQGRRWRRLEQLSVISSRWSCVVAGRAEQLHRRPSDRDSERAAGVKINKRDQ